MFSSTVSVLQAEIEASKRAIKRNWSGRNNPWIHSSSATKILRAISEIREYEKAIKLLTKQ